MGQRRAVCAADLECLVILPLRSVRARFDHVQQIEIEQVPQALHELWFEHGRNDLGGQIREDVDALLAKVEVVACRVLISTECRYSLH